LATIPFGYSIVKQAAGKRAGFVAALFLALAPFLVRYSQEARMYGILSLFIIL